MTGLEQDHLRQHVVEQLDRARARTNALTEIVDDKDLTRRHSPLTSPLVWDLTHVGVVEERWLLRNLAGADPLLPDEVASLYDALRYPWPTRSELPLLAPDKARKYIEQVRGRVLDLVSRISFADAGRLAADGFVFGLVAQHEQQHDEKMLITHQMRQGDPVLRAPAPLPAMGAPQPDTEVLVPAGPFTMGTSTDPWARDNERPAHPVDVPAFWIDAYPVTNGQFQAFIENGGYEDHRLWAPRGWEYRKQADFSAPLFWQWENGSWWRQRFGRMEPIPESEPVVHVSWFEADAYARWTGRRLPTEAEWEKAARFDPATGVSRRYPWGDQPPSEDRANLGQRHLSPAPIGSYPDGASALGVHQLIGDVWEWTGSQVTGYPGFEAWPSREQSEAHFGSGHRILRGGSFGTDPLASQGTFRNWDSPLRRQIFAGFRCVREVASGVR
jgi:gamma-glutamyl hercynylcysteine S-oxide synthase